MSWSNVHSTLSPQGTCSGHGCSFPGRFPAPGRCSISNSSLPPQEGAPALLVEHLPALQLHLLRPLVPSIPCCPQGRDAAQEPRLPQTRGCPSVSLPGCAVLSQPEEDITLCFICRESSRRNLCSSSSSKRSAQVSISPSGNRGKLLTPAPSSPAPVPWRGTPKIHGTGNTGAAGAAAAPWNRSLRRFWPQQSLSSLSPVESPQGNHPWSPKTHPNPAWAQGLLGSGRG